VHSPRYSGGATRRSKPGHGPRGDSLMRGVWLEAVDAGGQRTHLLLLARLGEGVPNLPLNR
jgi:hypothetical protein